MHVSRSRSRVVRRLLSSYSSQSHSCCWYRQRRIITPARGGQAAAHSCWRLRWDTSCRSYSCTTTTSAARTTSPLDSHSIEEEEHHLHDHQARTSSSSHVCFSSLPSYQRQTSALLTPRDWMESAKETRFHDDVWGALTIPATASFRPATPLLWNLRRLGQATTAITGSDDDQHDDVSDLRHASHLSSMLFFQVLMRESPPVLCRNSSLPASYVTTPSIMGSMFGLSLRRFLLQQPSSSKKGQRQQKDPDQCDKEYLLKHHGIQSNRIVTCDEKNTAQWTGISMARWMQLLPNSANSGDANEMFPVWTCTVWLLALQQIANSPACLSEFWSATDRAMMESRNEDEFLLSTLSSERPEDGSSLSLLRQSTLSWLQEESHTDNRSISGNQFRKMPPVVSNGYYAPTVVNTGPIDDAPPTILWVADCMEVVIREVLNLLLWNHQTGSFDLARIPSTALSELHRLYSNDEDHDGHGLGQAWFDMLSDIQDCDYFEQVILSSETGKCYKYELAPTVDNLVCALQHVLLGGTISFHQEEDSHRSFATTQSKNKWSTLQDAVDFLGEENHHHQQQQQSRTSSNKGSTNVVSSLANMKALIFHHDVLTHGTGSSDGEARGVDISFQHDFLTLRINGSPHAIEIRLRCDWEDKSGMAVVTHMYDNEYDDAKSTTKTGPSTLSSAKEEEPQKLNEKKNGVLQLLDQEWAKLRSSNAATSQTEKHAAKVFCLNAVSWALNVAPRSRRKNHGYLDLDGVDENNVMSVICKLLTQAYGPDRRRIAVPAETQAISLAQQRTSHESLAEAIRLSCRLIQRHNNYHKKKQDVGMDLLCWLLTETPVVVESSPSHGMTKDSAWLFQQQRIMEKALLGLPLHCRQEERLQDSLFRHRWLIDGPVVSMMLQWENNQVTMDDIVRNLGLIDSLRLLQKYYYSFRQS